jgi:TonB-linked SusC/RagA family outer membrane protein
MKKRIPIRRIILVCIVQTGLLLPIMATNSLNNINELLLVNPADSKQITGAVKDDKGEVMIGVTVTVKGTTVGTITDLNGRFTLNIPENGKVLSFSYIGMEPQEIAISGKTVINAILVPSAIALQEVVAVGYGTAKKVDITGSVVSVNSKELTSSGASTLEQALSGRTAGVVINAADNAPGAGMTIQIRGANSISASSAPLYVIDGFPVEGAFSSGSNQSLTASSPLSNIDPNDIESIDILKDASATAVYGARGANGVVIITTKSGRDGKTKVSFNANYGVQNMIDKYVPGDTKFYAQAQHDRWFPYDKRISTPPTSSQYFKWWDVAPYASSDTINTNWMDAIQRQGNIKNYNISMSAGNNKGNYIASIGYFNTHGVIKATDASRYTGSFKAEGSPNDWLKLSFNNSFAFSENNGTVTVNAVDGSSAGAGILSQAIKAIPLLALNSETLTNLDSDGNLMIGSPLEVLNKVKMNRQTLESRTNFGLTLTPMKGITVRSTLGLYKNKTDTKSYAPSTTSWGALYNGRSQISTYENSSWLNENTINYYKWHKKYQITALAGFSQQYNTKFNTSMESTNFANETLGYNNIGVGSSVATPNSYSEDFLLLSYFGRLNLNFKERYLLTATFRADGSSKFAQNNKWGYFPSFSAAWRAGEEEFIKNLGVFDNLKVRAGWGETGNPNISPYQSLTNYGLTKYSSGNTFITGSYPINIGNPNLKWETSVQTNIGIDFSMFKSRLTATIDAYLKQTKDLLLTGDIPASTGFSSYLYNAGSIENKGIEVTITGIILKGKFNWTATLNNSINRNKVTSLGSLISSDKIVIYDFNKTNSSTAMLKIGQPIGLWYGYETDGLWQQSDFTWNNMLNKYVLNKDASGVSPAAVAGAQPGQWKFKDKSGVNGVPDGKIDAYDKGAIANSQPKFTGGLNNSFNYKNFELTFFMEWSVGRDIYNANIRHFTGVQTAQQNTMRFDYWKPIQYPLDASGNEIRTITDANGNLVPNILPGGEGNIDAKYPLDGQPLIDMHDGYVEKNISYLRIKNLMLAYNVDAKLVKSLRMSSLKVFANVLNLHTFTNYSGYDPNVNTQDLNGLRPGYDLNSYPLSQTFMVGLNANF